MAADVKVLNNVEKLKSLLDDPCNCLEIVTQTMQFQLPSYFSEDPIRGIREMLNIELKRYSSRWKGNAMAYENVRLKQRGASLMGDLPFMALEAAVDFIVFRPKIGSTLRGIVNKISRDHIGCLILGCFNASLLRSHDDDAWDSPVVKIGSSVLLEVTSLNISGKVTFIRGRLLQVDDGQGNLNELVQSSVLDDDGYVSELQPSLPSISSVDDIFQKPEAIYKRPVKKYFENDELDSESQNESPKKKSKSSVDDIFQKPEAIYKQPVKKYFENDELDSESQNESPKKKSKTRRSKSNHNSLNGSSSNKLADEQFQKLKRKTKGERISESDTSVDIFITQTPSRSHATVSSNSSESEDEPGGNISPQAEVSSLSVIHTTDDDVSNTDDFPDGIKSTKKKEKDAKSKKKHPKFKKKKSRDSSDDVSATVTEDTIKSSKFLKSPVQTVSKIEDTFSDIVDDKNKKSKRKSKDKPEVKHEFDSTSIYSTMTSMTDEQMDLNYGSGFTTPQKLKKKRKSESGIKKEPMATSTPYTDGGNSTPALSTDGVSINVIKTDAKVKGKRKFKMEDTSTPVKRLKSIAENLSSKHNSVGLESPLFQHNTSARAKTATKSETKKKRKDSSAMDSGNSITLPSSSSIKKVAENGSNEFPVTVKVESKDFYSDDDEVLELMNLKGGWKGFAMASESFSSSKAKSKTPQKVIKDKKLKHKKKKKNEEPKDKKKKKKNEEPKDKKKKKKNEEPKDKKKKKKNEEPKDKKKKKKNEEPKDKKKKRKHKTSSQRSSTSSSKKHKIKKKPG